VTRPRRGELRSRLHEPYATSHVSCGGDKAVTVAYRCDIRPLLPSLAAGPVVDLCSGHGELVQLMQADGFDVEGIGISPKHGVLACAAGVARVRQRDFRAIVAAHQAHCAAITDTDLLEHLTKSEVLQTFDDAALASGDVLVGRVPNTARPLERAHT
jgi:hypothetical protein